MLNVSLGTSLVGAGLVADALHIRRQTRLGRREAYRG